jgi:hypothetical protein
VHGLARGRFERVLEIRDCHRPQLQTQWPCELVRRLVGLIASHGGVVLLRQLAGVRFEQRERGFMRIEIADGRENWLYERTAKAQATSTAIPVLEVI